MKILAYSFLSLWLVGSIHGETIASYIDGTATTGANLAAPVAGITVSDLTSTGITFGTVTSISRTTSGVTETVTTPAGPTAGSAAGSRWLNALNTQVATSSPVSTDDYYSFTLTADSGNLPALGALKFDIVTAAAASDGAINGTYQLFVAADGGAFSAVGSPGTAANPNTTDLVPGGQKSSVGSVLTASIDLTGLAPANSYEFRIALGDNSGSGVKTTWLQGIQVTPPSEPSGAVLITSFENVGANLWQVGLSGPANGAFVFRSSEDLSFSPGTLLENLTQGDPGDPGTIGGTNDSVLTLDENGVGLVRVTLTGATRDFLRAETAPE